jgi:hypothetical protein
MNLNGFQVQDRLARDAQAQVPRVLRREARAPSAERIDATRDLVEAPIVIADLDDQRERSLGAAIAAIADRERREGERRSKVVLEPGILLQPRVK